MHALDRTLTRFFVDVFAMRELFLDHVDFLRVLQPRGPLPGPEANDATDDFRRALEENQRAGDRLFQLGPEDAAAREPVAVKF